MLIIILWFGESIKKKEDDKWVNIEQEKKFTLFWKEENTNLAMIGPARRHPKKQPIESREASHEASCKFTF